MNNTKIKIAPSILSADFARLGLDKGDERRHAYKSGASQQADEKQEAEQAGHGALGSDCGESRFNFAPAS